MAHFLKKELLQVKQSSLFTVATFLGVYCRGGKRKGKFEKVGLYLHLFLHPSGMVRSVPKHYLRLVY